MPSPTPGTVRLSFDTKAVVAIGDLSRGGKSRQGEQALDHDFEPELKVTPFGVFRPDTHETWLFFTTGSATAYDEAVRQVVTVSVSQTLAATNREKYELIKGGVQSWSQRPARWFRIP